MADYRISNRARVRLLDIYAFTEEQFGPYQAEAYQAGFEYTFALLAKFPGIGRPVYDLAPRYLRYRYQSHYIFYTEEPSCIIIRNILHAAEDIRAELFE